MPKVLRGAARRELIEVLRPRYRGGTKIAKQGILEELIAVTGYHRKSAIRALNRTERNGAGVLRSSRRVYDDTFKHILLILWSLARHPCGKRMHALMPRLVAEYERRNSGALSPALVQKLNVVSAATIDRLLRESRKGNSAARRERDSHVKVFLNDFEDLSRAAVSENPVDVISNMGAAASVSGCRDSNRNCEDDE
ncbi:MAG: hypothetical protein M0Z85_11485 [Gammaproteobacteria bacterium]|nr:hypothetical protein [Gammaproteobacteria bacterium]